MGYALRGFSCLVTHRMAAWNSVFKKRDEDPWSEMNFGSMRGASSMYPIQQQNEEVVHENVHLKSSFNVINTLSASRNALANTAPLPPSGPPRKKRRITATKVTKRKAMRTKVSASAVAMKPRAM